MKQTVATTPLRVGLERGLIRTDLGLESFFALLSQRPRQLVRLPWWFLRGRARKEIARRVQLDVRLLPYDETLLRHLRDQKAAGRRLVLATASHGKLGRRIADHLGLFDRVLPGAVAGRPDGLGRRRDSPHAYLRAMRPHQWVKNCLLFVPLLAAHRVHEVPLLLQATLAFLSFGLCASAVYLINDLLDLQSDRRHPHKRHRPFAAGTASIARGATLVPLLLAAAFGVALALPPAFLGLLAAYLAITLAYSLRLKQVLILDVLVLAGLYTLRIVAGAAAISLQPSFWLLAFSMFLFLSLAMAKRYSELLALQDAPPGRRYEVADLDTFLSLGGSSGHSAVLVLALYINSEKIRELYTHPQFVWLLCPLLLFWVCRLWVVARRGNLHHDPVVFILRDRPSRWVVAAGLLIVLLAV